MKTLQLIKVASFASLLALSIISCAAYPGKPKFNPPHTTDHDDLTLPANYVKGKDGLFIPIDNDGKPFEQCGEEGSKNACPLYKHKTKVKEIKTTVINEIIYEINPHCIQICIDYPDNRAARCYVRCSSQLPANP